LALGATALLAFWPHRSHGAAPRETEPPGVRAAPGWRLFAGTNVPAFAIDIDAVNVAALRRQPRVWAKATVRFGDAVFADVGVHIKGSQGSLQSIDEQPSLTVSFNKFVSGQKLEGLRKVHFNNTAEDPSFMTEVLCSEMCRRAGLPAARAAHATLTLNGRRLGLYVLKEGLTKDFLAQYFKRTDGNLYDGGFQVDIDAPLERIGGEGVDDQSDRLALLAAARERDLATRWQRLEQVLDMDRFITLLAVTTMTWNWDGYPMARNNYRIYHDPQTDKMVFIPHGLDQMFWEPQGTIYPRLNGLVAAAVMRTPEGRRRYRARLAVLQTNVFRVADLKSRLSDLTALIRPYWPEAGAQAGALQLRIAARARSIAEQLRFPEPGPVQFIENTARLQQWHKLGDDTFVTLDESAVEQGRRVLRIKAQQSAAAAWIHRAWLQPGAYEFTALVRTHEIQPMHGRQALGAGIRASSSSRPAIRRLASGNDWEELRCRFNVRGLDELVELACELRGATGEVWFDKASLQLRAVSGGSLLDLFR
jgi:hypothetical protein